MRCPAPAPPSKATQMATAAPSPHAEEYEEAHVHSVYESIAPHFSSTRYKVCVPRSPSSSHLTRPAQPWPIIERFLHAQPAGSIGLDAGCGNGKYLPVNSAVCILASDRSPALVGIARTHTASRAHDALVADALALPHPLSRFDFAISVAVVHHLSTRARRVAALADLLACLVPGRGTLLVFVWALEQSSSRRGWSAGDAQDVMVPWVLQRNVGQGKRRQGATEGEGEAGEKDTAEPQTFHRFYHLYRQGELGEDLEQAGGTVVESGYEKDNWWAIAKARALKP